MTRDQAIQFLQKHCRYCLNKRCVKQQCKPVTCPDCSYVAAESLQPFHFHNRLSDFRTDGYCTFCGHLVGSTTKYACYDPMEHVTATLLHSFYDSIMIAQAVAKQQDFFPVYNVSSSHLTIPHFESTAFCDTYQNTRHHIPTLYSALYVPTWAAALLYAGKRAPTLHKISTDVEKQQALTYLFNTYSLPLYTEAYQTKQVTPSYVLHPVLVQNIKTFSATITPHVTAICG